MRKSCVEHRNLHLDCLVLETEAAAVMAQRSGSHARLIVTPDKEDMLKHRQAIPLGLLPYKRFIRRGYGVNIGAKSHYTPHRLVLPFTCLCSQLSKPFCRVMAPPPAKRQAAREVIDILEEISYLLVNIPKPPPPIPLVS